MCKGPEQVFVKRVKVAKKYMENAQYHQQSGKYE